MCECRVQNRKGQKDGSDSMTSTADAGGNKTQDFTLTDTVGLINCYDDGVLFTETFQKDHTSDGTIISQ